MPKSWRRPTPMRSGANTLPRSSGKQEQRLVTVATLVPGVLQILPGLAPRRTLLTANPGGRGTVAVELMPVNSEAGRNHSGLVGLMSRRAPG